MKHHAEQLWQHEDLMEFGNAQRIFYEIGRQPKDRSDCLSFRHSWGMTYEFANADHGNHYPRKGLRSPKRISITLPYGAYQRLIERSDQEGRSLSNLAAFLLESAIGCQRDSTDRLL